MLQRKLGRDLVGMKGQVLTIALVVASATGGFFGSLGTYHALQRARDTFYETARFAHVFVDLKRAPELVLRQVAGVPGVVDAEANVAASSQLMVEGVAEPLIARLVGIPLGDGPRLNRLPGVMQAEPYRSVAVQLRAGPQVYRTAVLGLNAGSTLRRTLDEAGWPVEIPPFGPLLSSRRRSG